MKYETSGEVLAGELRLRDMQALKAEFLTWRDGPVWLSIHSAQIFRTKGQNTYWHAAIVKPLAEHCRVSPRQMHEALKVRLLPEVIVIPTSDGRTLATITIGGSTTELTKNEAANLIDRGGELLSAAGLEVAEKLEPLSHFVPWDTPKGRVQTAICGALISGRDHSNDPTCPACRTRLKAREKMKF